MECVGVVPPAEDLDRDYVRVPKPKQRTRGAFKCPSCGLSLQAVLKHELTTVQCECSRIFCVRLPPKKGGGGRPSSNHLAPLRSILKPKSAKAANEEDDARSCSSSSRSVASSQFVVASASSVSSVHVASAPSVVSVDSFDSSRLRECDRLSEASEVPSSADVSGRGTPVQARWLDPTTDVSTWLTSLVSNLTAASDGGRAPTIHEGHFNAPER